MARIGSGFVGDRLQREAPVARPLGEPALKRVRRSERLVRPERGAWVRGLDRLRLRRRLARQRQRLLARGDIRARLHLHRRAARVFEAEAGQHAAEPHGREPAAQGRTIRLPRGQVGDRGRQRRVLPQGHEFAGKAGVLGVEQQHVATLGGLHGRRGGEDRLEVAELRQQLRRVLRPDARHARHVVDLVADQRLHVDQPVRRDAEFLHHLRGPDRLLLDRVKHLHARPQQLHQILVGRDDGHAAAAPPSPRGSRTQSGRPPPSPRVRRRARRTPRSRPARGRIAA